MSGKCGSFVLAGVACLGLFGCAGTGGRLDTQRRIEAVEDQSVPPDVRNAILEGRVTVGMSEGMVAASWGLPRKVDVDRSEGIYRESWLYGTRFTPGWNTTLDFEDGTLVDIRQLKVDGYVSPWERAGETYHADPHQAMRAERGMSP